MKAVKIGWSLLRYNNRAGNIFRLKKSTNKIRKVKVGVGSAGRLIYLAVEPEFIRQELEKLFAKSSS